MANYSLVIGSKYSPFTFGELLKPALMATQAHMDLEEQYSDLGTKANSWEDLINEQVDAELHNKVSQYSKDLKSQADLLASQGLTPATRKELLAMKNRYSKDITPIELAYNKREALVKEQREALLKDPSLIFDTDYSTSSLKSIMNNPNASFNPISGEDIAKRTAVMAKEAASAVLNDPEYTSVFNSQYVQQKIQQGYDMSQIIAAAQRDPKAPKALLGIVDTIKGEVGYDKWSPDNQGKIDSYINEGLRAAIGTPKIDVMTNRNYMSEIDRERLELAKEEFEWRKEQEKGIKQPDGSYIKPLGGGRYIITKPDGTTEIGAAENPDNNELRENLNKVTNASGIRQLGYTPSVAIIRSGDGWTYGREKEDIEGSGFWPNTNLRTGWWGNISYSPENKNAEFAVISNNEDIPGYKEYNSGDPYKDTAFGNILKAAESSGLIVYKTKKDKTRELDEKGRPIIDRNKSRFFTDDVQIVKVKSVRPGGRLAGEEYDYLIYTR